MAFPCVGEACLAVVGCGQEEAARTGTRSPVRAFAVGCAAAGSATLCLAHMTAVHLGRALGRCALARADDSPAILLGGQLAPVQRATLAALQQLAPPPAGVWPDLVLMLCAMLCPFKLLPYRCAVAPGLTPRSPQGLTPCGPPWHHGSPRHRPRSSSPSRRDNARHLKATEFEPSVSCKPPCRAEASKLNSGASSLATPAKPRPPPSSAAASDANGGATAPSSSSDAAQQQQQQSGGGAGNPGTPSAAPAVDPLVLEARALSTQWMARCTELVATWYKEHVPWQVRAGLGGRLGAWWRRGTRSTCPGRCAFLSNAWGRVWAAMVGQGMPPTHRHAARRIDTRAPSPARPPPTTPS